MFFNHRFASTEKAMLAEQLVDVVSLPSASIGVVAATNGIQNENTISVLLNFEVEEVQNLPELTVWLTLPLFQENISLWRL